jgi:hypothetical protein
MSKNTCEKFTTAIQTLQTLQRRADLSIQKFEPGDALQAKEESLAILEANSPFRGFFKEETYEYFVKVFGGEKEFRNQVLPIRTTGMSGNELRTALAEKKLDVGRSAEAMLASPEFQVVPAGETIRTIWLEVSSLFGDENIHSYGEILAKANELGLGLLPHETAANILLNATDQGKIIDWYRIPSNPLKDSDGFKHIFLLVTLNDHPMLDCYSGDFDSRWRPGLRVVFSVPNPEKLADSNN